MYVRGGPGPAFHTKAMLPALWAPLLQLMSSGELSWGAGGEADVLVHIALAVAEVGLLCH